VRALMASGERCSLAELAGRAAPSSK